MPDADGLRLAPTQDGETTVQPPPATPERHFLGWQRPLLPSAADWLIERGQRHTLIDLDPIVVVVPGRRAGRRLLETLAERALERGSAGLVPPRIVTPGQLVEVLVPSKAPVAGELEQLLARLRVLSDASAAELEPLLPREVQKGETHRRDREARVGFTRWLELARTLEKLSGELAVEGLTLPFAANLLAERLEFPEVERWRVLAMIERRTEALLATSGWRSAHRSLVEAAAEEDASAQLQAAATGAAALEAFDSAQDTVDQVVLVGVAELGRALKRVLSSFSRHRSVGPNGDDGRAVHALVGAPEALAELFDDWGLPRTRDWQQRCVDSSQANLRVVDRPRDQTSEAVRRLSSWRKDGVDPSAMTLGLGDSTAARGLQEALAMAGFRSHSPLGRTLGESRPVRVIELLARFVDNRGARELAELLRQPDLERLLLRHFEPRLKEDSGLSRELLAAIEERDWLSFFDRYSQDTLVRDLGMAPGPRAAAQLVTEFDRFFVALAEEGSVPPGNDGALGSGEAAVRLPGRPARRRRRIDAWSPVVSRLLSLVFGDLELRADRETDAELIEALTRLGDLLRRLADLGDLVPETPISFGELVRLALAGVKEVTLSREQTEGTSGAAIEVLGWLELALDDAPNMVILHLNEGFLPESQVSDPFLPDQVRRALGLMNNQRRYARDLFLFQSLVESRRELVLISGRRSADDEPLAPSRLLLAGHRYDPSSLARAVVRYYDGATDSTAGRSLPFAHGERLRAGIPNPEHGLGEPSPREVLSSLSVTAFRDYLACPYRFYLNQVLKLETLRDLPQELDGRGFGNVAHEVLRRFSLSDAVTESTYGSILDALETILSAELKRCFGFRQPAALRVQAAQLRRRLELFAHWQVDQLREGWQVERDWVERKVVGNLEVDGCQMVVRGKVDRVDRHPELGYRVIDWKTSDRRREPAEIHRSRSAVYREWHGWSDLQLPLYRHLLEQTDDFQQRPVELGYCLLSADLTGELWAPVPWTDSDHRQALAVAEQVVRLVRQRVFWPPKAAPSWDDGLRWLAWDSIPSGPRLLPTGDYKPPEPERPQSERSTQKLDLQSDEGPLPEWPPEWEVDAERAAESGPGLEEGEP